MTCWVCTGPLDPAVAADGSHPNCDPGPDDDPAAMDRAIALLTAPLPTRRTDAR